MTVFRYFLVGSTCATAFAGSAYVVALSLAPPPQYTVSDTDRIHRYNELAINDAYESKTRMQEFYLGLTRWRRRILRDEKLLTGRVLEVGAGCGTNLSLYPATYFTDNDKAREALTHVFDVADPSVWRNARTTRGGSASVIQVLHDVLQAHTCDEIVLCDRAANMVESCARNVQTRFGYTPYRYPDYSPERVSAVVHGCRNVDELLALDAVTATATASATQASSAPSRCVMHASSVPPNSDRAGGASSVNTTASSAHEEATVAAVPCRSRACSGDDTDVCCDGVVAKSVDCDDSHADCTTANAIVVPIVSVPASVLMSNAAVDALQRRAQLVHARQCLRYAVSCAVDRLRDCSTGTRVDALAACPRPPPLPCSLREQTPASLCVPEVANRLDTQLRCIDSVDAKGSKVACAADCTTSHDTSATQFPLRRQPLFSVANYAAEQLPFADNSFDTVVDMFGLCSYDDPVRALRELSRVCKPNGKLLLLEHGRGSSARVNRYLDKWAPRHARQWGCWWNRHVMRMLRLGGVVVDKHEMRHFGTSHYIVARPYKTMDELEAFATSAQAP